MSALPLADGPAMYFGSTIMTFALPYGAFIAAAIALFYLFRATALRPAAEVDHGQRRPGHLGHHQGAGPDPGPGGDHRGVGAPGADGAASGRSRLPTAARSRARPRRTTRRKARTASTGDRLPGRAPGNGERDGGGRREPAARQPPHPPGGRGRARRADQAPHHRAPPGDHGPHDAAGPARPPVPPARRGHAGRRHPRGRQRQHDQLLPRPRHRRGHEAHLRPPAGQQAGRHHARGGADLGHRARRGRDRAARPGRQLAGGRRWPTPRSCSTSSSTRCCSSAVPRPTS